MAYTKKKISHLDQREDYRGPTSASCSTRPKGKRKERNRRRKPVITPSGHCYFSSQRKKANRRASLSEKKEEGAHLRLDQKEIYSQKKNIARCGNFATLHRKGKEKGRPAPTTHEASSSGPPKGGRRWQICSKPPERGQIKGLEPLSGGALVLFHL